MPLQHRLIVCALIFTLAGCDLIPGTEAYRVAQAKRTVAELLLDPASAEFRNVSARGDCPPPQLQRTSPPSSWRKRSELFGRPRRAASSGPAGCQRAS